jgi:hypothetical protein
MKTSKIKYQITDGWGLWEHYQSNGLVLEVLIDDVDDGYVQIKEVQSKLTDGLATLDLSILSDGIYEPVFVSDDKIVRLEKIEKANGTIAPIKTYDAIIRRLLKRVKRLETNYESLDKRTLAVEEKIQTDVLF